MGARAFATQGSAAAFGEPRRGHRVAEPGGWRQRQRHQYKGLARVVGRKSPNPLYSLAHVTFEEDQVYDQHDAEGLIKPNALRLRLMRRRTS